MFDLCRVTCGMRHGKHGLPRAVAQEQHGKLHKMSQLLTSSSTFTRQEAKRHLRVHCGPMTRRSDSLNEMPTSWSSRYNCARRLKKEPPVDTRLALGLGSLLAVPCVYTSTYNDVEQEKDRLAQ